MRILVTGAGGDSGLATIRILLASTKHQILAGDCNKFSSGLYLAAKHFILLRASDKSFLKETVKLVKKEKIDVIFPNVDEELLVFSKFRSKVPCQIIISSYKTVKICNDKLATINKLKRVIPTPKVFNKKNVKFPAVVRPRISRGSRNVFIVNNQREFEAISYHLKKKGIKRSSQLLQEYLPGEEYTVDLVCDHDGAPLVIVPRKRIATKGGISSIGKTVKNRRIIKSVKAICSKLKFFGPVNIQFKKDRKGNLKTSWLGRKKRFLDI